MLSESWQIRKFLLARMHVHASEFRAAMQCGHGFTRVEQRMLVECRFDAVKSRELERLELVAHRVDFFDADAVLARNGAADVDRQLQNFGAELLGAMQLARLVRVVENQRMQV